MYICLHQSFCVNDTYMKRFLKKITILACMILCLPMLFLTGCTTEEKTSADYLRLHIRANSNKEIDQRVKYEVRDKVVEYLTPLVADIETKGELVLLLNEHLSDIEILANRTLSESGMDYISHASIRQEYFPTRTYNDVTLGSDYYDALIIELGSGKGDNWWCVVYPPLCFVGGAGISTESFHYKSKLLEIINNFFGGK